MGNKLKPCPFCGGESVYHPEILHEKDCYIVLLSGSFFNPPKSKQEISVMRRKMTTAWNRRIEEAAK